MAPDEGLFRRTVERIAPLGWHVVLHVLAEDLIAHEALFREVRIPVMVDHMAHLDLDDADGARAFDLLVERYVPDEAARTRILVDNPQELYGFSGKAA